MPDFSVDSLTSRIMQRYDSNRDGKIQVNPNVTWQQEVFSPTILTESQQVQVDWDSTGSGYIVGKAVTMAGLFQDADANGDGAVTKEELHMEIASFDRNHNGIIGSGEHIRGSSASELDVLKGSYPETVQALNFDPFRKATYSTTSADLSTSVYAEPLTPAQPTPHEPTRREILQDQLRKVDAKIEQCEGTIAWASGYMDRHAAKTRAEDALNQARQERQQLLAELGAK